MNRQPLPESMRTCKVANCGGRLAYHGKGSHQTDHYRCLTCDTIHINTGWNLALSTEKSSK